MVDKVKAVGVGLGLSAGEKKRMKAGRKRMTERVRAIRKRRFLKRYGQRGSMIGSAEYAGVTEPAVRKWMKKDAVFAECFAAVKAAFVERLEEEADRRGYRGERCLRFYQGKPILDPRNGKALIECEYSDQLLMFRLKALKPWMYRDRMPVEQEPVHVKLYRGVDLEEV